MRGRRAVEGDGVLQVIRWLDRTPESFMPGHRRAMRLPAVPSNRILRLDTKRLWAAVEERRLAVFTRVSDR